MLLILLLPTLAACARIGGEVLLYEFAQADCEALSFPNTGSVTPGLTLNRDASLSSCVNGAVGVHSNRNDTHLGPRLRTSGDLTDVRSHLVTANAGMSLEFWMKPDYEGDEPSSKALLFTIGREEYPSSSDWTDQCSAASALGYYDFSVYHQSDFLRYSYSGERELDIAQQQTVNDAEHCKTANKILQTVNEDPVHIIITLKDREQRSYVNGALQTGVWYSFSEKFDANYIEAISHLEFFSNEFLHNNPEISNIPWTGELYLFALHDKVLTASDVTANYEAKLRNSLPTMTGKTVTINEDGEGEIG